MGRPATLMPGVESMCVVGQREGGEAGELFDGKKPDLGGRLGGEEGGRIPEETCGVIKSSQTAKYHGSHFTDEETQALALLCLFNLPFPLPHLPSTPEQDPPRS